MIKVEIFLIATENAFSSVSLPNFNLDLSGNQTVMLDSVGASLGTIDSLVANLQLELEYLSSVFFLDPGVDEFEHSRKRPNSSFNLLVDSNGLRGRSIVFMCERCLPKESVLR